ncbi:hypothetical protein IV38_GL001161 [Lactobacillus selangorensis]|uniref:Rrf2 family transcriptional regulator n=1 Tax=Lactobacillus selangorensis TaxID=81857 RepID=A0A0R2FMJ2_9LACO|nr:hypothetical protein IV38_GL001161 [Lactobacillus selangorensis]KRN32640.1 hypothetical protein IV40_GL000692 [Lactobacillus selangorensis]
MMLGTQKGQQPLKSAVLSKRLQLSDSYLKKTMHLLVSAGIVRSIASKDGGFQLNRAPEDITVLDIYQAVEGTEPLFRLTGVAERVFLNPTTIHRKENEIMGQLDEAQSLFFEQLAQYRLADILVNVDYPDGTIDWNEVVK